MISTKERIQNAFLELYCNNDIEKIKVNTICTMSNIGRTTFYKYYKKVDDILSDIEKNTYKYFKKLKEQITDIDVCNIKEGEIAINILEIYRYIYKNPMIFKAFFNKNKDHLIIIKIKKQIKTNLKETYYKYFNNDIIFDCFAEIVSTLLINYSLIIIEYYEIINIETLAIKTQETIKDLIINKDKYYKKETAIL